MKNLDVTKLNEILGKYGIDLESFISHFNFDGDTSIDDIITYLEKTKNEIKKEVDEKQNEFKKEREDYLKKMIRQNQEKNREILPLLNISEDDSVVYFEMVVPMLKKENIDIKIEENFLKIKGKYEHPDMKERKYHQYEFKLIDFKKEIPLGVDLDLETISASYNEGILSITIKKEKRPTITKEISVKF